MRIIAVSLAILVMFISAGIAGEKHLKVKSYVNVDGERVQSPRPAKAQCAKDDAVSFSKNDKGTCSHHGGIAEKL